MNKHISTKNKLIFLAAAVILTVIVAFFDGFENPWRGGFVAIGVDAAAVGCIISMIVRLFTKRFSDWGIITIFVGFLTLIAGIPGLRRVMSGDWDLAFGGVLLLMFAVPWFITTIICAICWIVRCKRQPE